MIDFKERLPLAYWVGVLCIVQLVFAVVVLGCSAFGVYYIAYNAYCLSLFTAIATIIITVYMILAETVWKKGYNLWAFFALEIFSVIFWLSSFAVLADLLASWVASMVTETSYTCYGYYYCYKKRDLQKRVVTIDNYRDVIAVTLAFSVLEFLLFVTTLVVFSIALHHRRKNTVASPEVALETGTNEEVKHHPVEPAHTGAQPAVAHHEPATAVAPGYEMPTYAQQPVATPASTHQTHPNVSPYHESPPHPELAQH